MNMPSIGFPMIGMPTVDIPYIGGSVFETTKSASEPSRYITADGSYYVLSDGSYYNVKV